MYVREEWLEFSNLASFSITIPFNEWAEPVLHFRRQLIEANLYYQPTIIFTVEEAKEKPGLYDFTFYLSIHNPDPEFKDVNWTDIKYENALVVRCDEADDWNEAYQLLESHAAEHNLQLLKPFYHVSAEVFGEVITDIYAPYEEQKTSVTSENKETDIEKA